MILTAIYTGARLGEIQALQWSDINRVLRKMLKELGIDKPSFHFHALRHTHVAFLLANEIDLYVISKRLGHSDITTTSRVYSYLIDEYKIRSDNQIEKLLDNRPTTIEKVKIG